MKSIKSLLQKRDPSQRKKYITREFQDYGMRLAHRLEDVKNKSLYIKLAKTTNRQLLETALTFVQDATGIKSKAKLFMWKLKQLKIQS